MDVQLKEHDGVAVMAVRGEINISTSPQLKKELEKIQNPRLVINFSQVNYVDSSGLATLVDVYKKLKARSGGLCLTQLSDKVKSLFEITKLDRLFTILPDDAAAIGKLRS